MSGLASFVDGFFRGRDIRHDWDDRKRRQSREDELWGRQDQRWAWEQEDRARADQKRLDADARAARAAAARAREKGALAAAFGDAVTAYTNDQAGSAPASAGGTPASQPSYTPSSSTRVAPDGFTLGPDVEPEPYQFQPAPARPQSDGVRGSGGDPALVGDSGGDTLGTVASTKRPVVSPEIPGVTILATRPRPAPAAQGDPLDPNRPRSGSFDEPTGISPSGSVVRPPARPEAAGERSGTEQMGRLADSDRSPVRPTPARMPAATAGRPPAVPDEPGRQTAAAPDPRDRLDPRQARYGSFDEPSGLTPAGSEIRTPAVAERAAAATPTPRPPRRGDAMAALQEPSQPDLPPEFDRRPSARPAAAPETGTPAVAAARPPAQADPALSGNPYRSPRSRAAFDAAALPIPLEMGEAVTNPPPVEAPPTLSGQQRVRAARDMMGYVADVTAPKMVEYYVSQGELEKAQRWTKFIEDAQRTRGLKAWTKAVVAAYAGDETGFVDNMVTAYNANDYFADGHEIVRSKSRIVRETADGDADIHLTFRGPDGREFTQVFEKIADVYQMGIMMLSPDQAFEKLEEERTKARDVEGEIAVELTKAASDSSATNQRDQIIELIQHRIEKTADGPNFAQLPIEEQVAWARDFLAQAGAGAR